MLVVVLSENMAFPGRSTPDIKRDVELRAMKLTPVITPGFAFDR